MSLLVLYSELCRILPVPIQTVTFFFKKNFPTHSLYFLPGYHPSYTSYGVTHAALLSTIHDMDVLVMLFSLGGGGGGKNHT